MNIIVFGASGDLASRKLFPALYKLRNRPFQVIGYGRTNLTHNFHTHISRMCEYDDEFLSRVIYINGDYLDISQLTEFIDSTSICYLSVPPSVYLILIKQLINLGAQKICLEKPFGESSMHFKEIKELQNKKNINLYFIDHYLYKPMTLCISKLYQSMNIFKCIFNYKYINNIEISFKEQLGSEGRIYFDKMGLIRDVVQNHVGEILATVLTLEGERQEVLSKINCVKEDEILIGQYDEYKKELLTDSSIETFALIGLTINDPSLLNVPIILTAGKGLNEKRVEARIEFTKNGCKAALRLLSAFESSKLEELKNLVKEVDIENVFLVFNYSPENEIYLEIKSLYEIHRIVLIDESQTNLIVNKEYSYLEDHEIVLQRLLDNKPLSCASTEEASELWRLFDLSELIKTKKLIIYPKGIDLPDEAAELHKRIRKFYFKKR